MVSLRETFAMHRPVQAVPPPTAAASRTVRGALWRLAALCLLPAAAISLSLVWTDQQRRQAEAEQTAETAARAMAATLDRDLASVVATLRVLATEPSLQAGDLAAFQQRASDTLVHQNVTNYVLIDANFRQAVNTLRPWGSPLPTVAGPPELRRITEAGEVVLSDLFIGPVTGQPIIGLGVPVYVGNQVMYSINVGIEPQRLSQILQGARLPGHWVGAIIDRQGQVVARTRHNDRYVGRKATPELLHALRMSHHGTVKSNTLEGIPALGAYWQLDQFGWTVVIGIPIAELQTGWHQAIGFLLLSHLLLFGVVMLAAWQMAKRGFVLPTEGLLQRMRRVAAHRGPGPSATGEATTELQALEACFDELYTRLSQREAEGQEMIRRLSDTLEHMGDGFVALDSAGRITHLNSQAERLLAHPRQRLLGMPLHSIFNNQEAHPLWQACQQAQSQHQAASLVVPFTEAQRWLEIDLHPADWGLSVYFRDVSEAQRLREAQAARLVAESANQAKTEFLSRMSHELRTPLNAVLGFAQLLRLDTDRLSPRHAEMVGHIESAGQHLLAMISDVLDLSRIESGTLQVRVTAIDARAVAQQAVAMVKAQAASKGVSLRLDCACDHPSAGCPGLSVLADPTRLQQVLLNLLSNGIKYNRPEGSVVLQLQASDAGSLRFTVRDNGPGLSPKQAAHLFEPFNRLGREHGPEAGTGIGLVITRRLVGLLGGELAVSCQEGEGCTFWFELPTVPTAMLAHPTHPTAPPEPCPALSTTN